MSERNGSAAWLRHFVPRLALTLLSVVVALLAIEGALRVRQLIKHRTTSVTLYTFIKDPRTDLSIPRPRLDTGHIRIDSRGFRNPEIQMPKPRGRIRLAFLGASTTFCAEVSSNEATWPDQIARALSERYRGVTFDYINAAVPGYKLSHSLKNLRLRVATLEPDFVLYYEATNDLAKDTRELAIREGLFTDRSDKPPTGLARISIAYYLIQKNLLIRERARRERPGLTKLQFNADSLAGGFEQGLVGFLRAARQVAPVVAVATFSHKVRRSQPPEVQLRACTLNLYWMPFMSVEGFLDAWDAYNRAIRAAARESGAILIEGEDSIPGDDAHFVDSIHFSDTGATLMSDRVVRALVASPEFNQLVESRGGHALAATPRARAPYRQEPERSERRHHP